MTRAERPDDSPARPPKPSWGPGKNAALSIVAFAAIFGLLLVSWLALGATGITAP